MARKCLSVLKKRSTRLRSRSSAKSHGRGVFRLDLHGMTGAIALSLRAATGVGVERLVGDQSAGIDGFDERFSARQIVILARAEDHLDGIAEGVGERVNLGG